ncbi:ATP-binding protein [Sulfitobacter profundi]|uniref:histidine kinase n=1 Tax=Sulfitobacter profundi TaxID=2679961 RepID=A0ABW1YZ84_9RHOB
MVDLTYEPNPEVIVRQDFHSRRSDFHSYRIGDGADGRPVDARGFCALPAQGELARFDELATSLAERGQNGWAEFDEDPQLWAAFVHAHAPLPSRSPRFPPEAPPPPRPDNPPPFTLGDDNMRLEKRIVLLDRDGNQIAGHIERSALFERRPVCANNTCAGANLLGYIGLNAPMEQRDASDTFFLRGQYASLALAALIAIALSAAAAFIIARQLLEPVRRLEAGAKTMAAGNYTARIKQDRSDELGQLIGHYNTLAATLEQTAKAEREWISNTSHELQTPLAVLRAQIEALQDGIRQPDDKTLTEMHAALMRLSRLVQDLKTLSYGREAELTSSIEQEDLPSLVKQAAETMRSKLSAKGIELELNLPMQMWVPCDRGQIGQVMDNLLENAFRYTDGPGQIRVNLQDGEGFAQLTVEDTPPAAPEDDGDKLFDRFYRVEASRSRAHGGSGLGLSVCRAIVEAHGGTISAGRSELGGVQIVIRLPKQAV